MTDPVYRRKVVHTIIQDLAEVWLIGHERPRVLSLVADGEFKKIARKIQDVTGEPVSSRRLRDYAHGQIPRKGRCLDATAAAWLVEMGRLQKKDAQSPRAIDQRLEQCIAIFQQRRTLIMDRFGPPEGSTLEYKDQISGDEIAPLLSAFGNTQGGLAIFGVKHSHGQTPEIAGLTGEEPLLGFTKAALGRIPREQEIKVDYGWSYLKNEAALLFFILVDPPGPRHVPITATGKVYERRGSRTCPIDQPQEHRGPQHKSTKARCAFLRGLRRMLLITEPRLAMAPYDAGIVSSLVLVFLAESFVTYLLDVLGESVSKMTHPDFAGDINHNFEHRLEFLRRANIEAFLAGMRSSPALYPALEEGRPTLAKVFQLARIWRCKAGEIDQEYVTNAGGELNEERGVTIAETREYIDRINAISRSVDFVALKAYELNGTLVEDLPAIAY